MPKYGKADQQQAFDRLREWIQPGDTVYTILDHVSKSGMSRDIRVVLLKADDQGRKGKGRGTRYAVDLHPNWAVSVVLGLPRASKGDGMRVGGCGMDMGFHIVHSLGYALFGHEAEHGKGRKANQLRKAIYEADKHYWHQGGKTEKPDFTKGGREWFCGAGYALKHRWL